MKYYFLEFRNQGIFYETVINQVLDDLVKACQPRYMEVTGDFSIRGGMGSRIQALYDPSGRGVAR